MSPGNLDIDNGKETYKFTNICVKKVVNYYYY